MFAGVLAGRWPQAATLVDAARPHRPDAVRRLGEWITRLDLTVAAPAGTLTVRITEAS